MTERQEKLNREYVETEQAREKVDEEMEACAQERARLFPKYCPFCHYEPDVAALATGGQYKHFVRCQVCGAQGPLVLHADKDSLDAELEAIRLWNEGLF